MGEFEDRYDRLERQNADAAQSDRIAEYNRWVAVIREYGPKILAEYLKNPPDSKYRFVVIDGVRLVSWDIVSESYDRSWTVGFLADGRFVNTYHRHSPETYRIDPIDYTDSYTTAFAGLEYVQGIGQELYQEAHRRGIQTNFDYSTARRV